jgi:predicted outer membrane repeat protein
VDSTEFTSNGAVSYGGALYLNGMFTANIKNTVSFGSNFAANGGGKYCGPSSFFGWHLWRSLADEWMLCV